jgi:hypothetical protein
MPLSDFSYEGPRVSNNRNHILDLLTGTKLYVRDRLHDRGKKVRSDTPFFRPNGVLPANRLIRKKTEPISVKKIIQSTEQPISIGERGK